MADRSIRKNYIYNLAYQILTLLTPFITTPYVTRILTPYGIGLQSFAFAVSTNFAIFAAMGIETHGTREISYAQDDRKERTRIFWELKLLSLITTVIWLIIYITLVMLYVKNRYALFLVLTLNIIGVATNCMWLFYGMEDFGRIVVRLIISKILDIAFIFIFIKEESDVALYLFGSVFLLWATLMTLWFDIHEYVDWPDMALLKKLNPFRDIKTIISLFIPTIAVQVYTLLDKVMLGFLAEGTAESGYYELALRISKMPLMIVAVLSGVMSPRIGYLFKKNDIEAIHDYMDGSFKFAWFMSVPLCLGLMAVSDNFVKWFFGDSYGKVSDLMKVSSLLLIIIGLSNVTGNQYMIPTGQQKKFTITVTLGAVVNFTLNLFLIPNFYSDGALIASVAAEFSVFAAQLYFLRKELSIIKIFMSGIKYIFAGLIMFASLSAFNYKMPLNPLGTMAIIFSGAFIYFGVLLIMRDEFFISNSIKTFNFIKGKFLKK